MIGDEDEVDVKPWLIDPAPEEPPSADRVVFVRVEYLSGRRIRRLIPESSWRALLSYDVRRRYGIAAVVVGTWEELNELESREEIRDAE